ncbi:MAG TPA: alpha/beta family hydrolase [Solirubrobacteraceae bacterium]|nr:alpha/beta family hydrolase [Solirubrobacteraceae bacterium]
MDERLIETPRGPARVHLSRPAGGAPRGGLILGHGAGGGVGAPDLEAARAAALTAGLTVALVEQPYRVAGRRSPAPAPALDEAWTAVVADLGDGELRGLPIITGGRSSGARVACRTAAVTGAVAVLCLAFPLRPARRAGATVPPADRLGELDAVSVPVLVVQGRRDRFGMPPAAPARRVVEVAGDHGLKSDLPAVADAVSRWLEDVLEAARRSAAASAP